MAGLQFRRLFAACSSSSPSRQGIYVATAVAMAASVVQIAWLYGKHRRVAPVHWPRWPSSSSSAARRCCCGRDLHHGSRLALRAVRRILAVGRAGFGRNLIAYVMQGITLPDAVWTRSRGRGSCSFAASGRRDWYVASQLPTDTWVNFKVWGGSACSSPSRWRMVVLSRHPPSESHRAPGEAKAEGRVGARLQAADTAARVPEWVEEAAR
jgi:intracellular septation protein